MSLLDTQAVPGEGRAAPRHKSQALLCQVLALLLLWQVALPAQDCKVCCCLQLAHVQELPCRVCVQGVALLLGRLNDCCRRGLKHCAPLSNRGNASSRKTRHCMARPEGVDVIACCCSAHHAYR